MDMAAIRLEAIRLWMNTRGGNYMPYSPGCWKEIADLAEFLANGRIPDRAPPSVDVQASQDAAPLN